MTQSNRTEKAISVDRVFLHLQNPRHEPYGRQAEVIEYLCHHENVLPLARDIAKNGLNPLERFAMFGEDTQKADDVSIYIIGEGNRRMCAIKLLDDPELAPSEMRESFRNLADQWEGIDKIAAVVFEDRDDLDLWLRRIHHGVQGGIGRKDWNAEQKQRHSGSNKNRVALAILDYAEAKNFISPDTRKGKLTTVQRYVGNPIFREVLGIDVGEPDEVCRTRTEDDFDLLVKAFVSDLLNRPEEVSSRSNKDRIIEYARELGTTEGQTGNRISPEPIGTGREEEQSKTLPKKPRKLTRLPYDSEIEEKLGALKNYKLQHIYNSLCRVGLRDNTPLLAIGTWAFFETLTARAGRNGRTSFTGFFSNDRLQKYGFDKGPKRTSISAALGRIADYGNTTKHHETAATFNGDQLANDLETLKELIVKCVDEALSKVV